MGQRHVETDPKSAGKSQREYEHSSGDRNTKKNEKDWKGFSGGAQRDSAPAAPGAEPAKDADRR
ncbi:hypothetical protein [Lysobacter changpingensis]|jgi:hypothetical protein|uniref:hypothetical protein n=1 Tax=Lysobacter changpingensis TaxID=2792784 RepID=UPI001A8C5FDD|nr:hypothetical protein [Lysobacter changpingensis]